MMKKVVAITLLVAFLFHSFNKLVLIVNFEINKDYITKTFCENISKPKLACNGKCHLSKELKKEENKQNAPSNLLKEIEISLFVESDEASPDFNNKIAALQPFEFYILKPYTAPEKGIYHPPKFC